jgi:hypothetical protein
MQGELAGLRAEAVGGVEQLVDMSVVLQNFRSLQNGRSALSQIEWSEMTFSDVDEDRERLSALKTRLMCDFNAYSGGGSQLISTDWRRHANRHYPQSVSAVTQSRLSQYEQTFSADDRHYRSKQ